MDRPSAGLELDRQRDRFARRPAIAGQVDAQPLDVGADDALQFARAAIIDLEQLDRIGPFDDDVVFPEPHVGHAAFARAHVQVDFAGRLSVGAIDVHHVGGVCEGIQVAAIVDVETAAPAAPRISADRRGERPELPAGEILHMEHPFAEHVEPPERLADAELRQHANVTLAGDDQGISRNRLVRRRDANDPVAILIHAEEVAAGADLDVARVPPFGRVAAKEIAHGPHVLEGCAPKVDAVVEVRVGRRDQAIPVGGHHV